MLILMEIRDDRDNKKIAIAIVLSVLIHFGVIGGVAVVLTMTPAKETPAEPEPIELTILPEPAPTPLEDPYIETTEAQRSATAPDQKTFESDKDTQAASEKPAVTDKPLPSQDGRPDQGVQFEDRKFTLGPKPLENMPIPPNHIARPMPAPRIESKPSETPVPQPSPDKAPPDQAKPEPTVEPSELALLKPAPPKAEKPKTETAQNAPPPAPPPQPKAYRPETRTTRIQGGISNRGRSAVNAVATPMGRYKKMLSDAIGSRWYYYVQNDMGLLNIGTVVIRFVVRPDGRVEGVRVLTNSSNESFANTSVRSIIEAEIPPIPPEVASVLEDGKIEVDYTFTIMNN